MQCLDSVCVINSFQRIVIRDGKYTPSVLSRIKRTAVVHSCRSTKTRVRKLCPNLLYLHLHHHQTYYSSGISSLGFLFFYWVCPVPSLLQAVEAAQLAEDLKVQLEHTQAKLKEIQVSVAENRTARERESSNLKRAQVCWFYYWEYPNSKLALVPPEWKSAPGICVKRLFLCCQLGGAVPAKAKAGETEEGGGLLWRWWDPAGGD